jgi:hypothetical protein
VAFFSNIDIFPPRERDAIISEIFLNHFFRFFLHWNGDVRIVFQHLLIYRVFTFETVVGSMENGKRAGRS